MGSYAPYAWVTPSLKLDLGNHIVEAIKDQRPISEIVIHLKHEFGGFGFGIDDYGLGQTLWDDAVPRAFQLQHALLSASVTYAHLGLIGWVFRKGYDVDSKYLSYVTINPLHLAFYIGCQRTIHLFLQQKPNVHQIARVNNIGPKSAFAFLLRHDDVSLMLPWLPYFKESCDPYSRTAMHVAAEEGAFNCLEYLVEHNPEDINAKDYSGYTPLLYSIRHGNRFVDLLLQQKSSIWAKTASRGRQCLHLLFTSQTLGNHRTGVPQDAVMIIQCLLAKGADVNAFDANTETPLCLACKCVSLDTQRISAHSLSVIDSCSTEHKVLYNSCECLLDNGAALNYPTGNTPLNILFDTFKTVLDALILRHATFVEYNPDVLRPSLELALQIHELFLKCGANPERRNIWGQSPLTQVFLHLQSARHLPRKQVDRLWVYVFHWVRLLLQYGARNVDLCDSLVYGAPCAQYQCLVTMVLSCLPHYEYYMRLRSALDSLHLPKDPELARRFRSRTWVYSRLENPRSLRQLARCHIVCVLGSRLLTYLSKLPLPPILLYYVGSFEEF